MNGSDTVSEIWVDTYLTLTMRLSHFRVVLSLSCTGMPFGPCSGDRIVVALGLPNRFVDMKQ